MKMRDVVPPTDQEALRQAAFSDQFKRALAQRRGTFFKKFNAEVRKRKKGRRSHVARKG